MLALALFVLTLSTNAYSFPGRIVGGKDAVIEDYPYQISLQYYGGHFCGGSIVTKRHIVTAAHCTDGLGTRNMEVRVGSSFSSASGKLIKVEDILQHPLYNENTYNYDISVLVLAEDITFDETAQPIEMTEEEAEHGAECVVTGWGDLTEGGAEPEQLQTLTLPIIGRSQCRDIYGDSRITRNMICAGFIEGGKDSCQGDSGGPLAHDGKLVGVVSWGIGCARPNRPGIYSNVATLRSYVDGITNG